MDLHSDVKGRDYAEKKDPKIDLLSTKNNREENQPTKENQHECRNINVDFPWKLKKRQ